MFKVKGSQWTFWFYFDACVLVSNLYHAWEINVHIKISRTQIFGMDTLCSINSEHDQTVFVSRAQSIAEHSTVFEKFCKL